MPHDLQADVIVPIVNFMYTGTLEFHYSMYEKLLKTSREMNMTVLSKLLEAHRQTSTVGAKNTQQPVLLNKNAGVRSPTKVYQQSKALPTKTVIYKQGQTIIKHVSPKPNIPEPIQIVTRFQASDKNASTRPSRFNVPDEIVPDTEGSFESISYESKPIQTASGTTSVRDEENSPFESLKRGYTNKRAATISSSQSPPVKKPNLEDIKAEAEAQSLRNDFEDDDDEDDDPDYDADQYFDDEGGSDDEVLGKNSHKTSPGGTVVKHATKQITVSDCSGGNIDHAKILSEVLKKYPNLVKNPKNIKLKIMQKPSSSNPQQTTAIVRVIKNDSASGGGTKIVTSTQSQVRPSPAVSAANQPKKIDAKTMHELIKLGAENMKGPWLCLECGSGGRPISIPTYRKFRAHLTNVHKQKIDPKICEHCGLKPARRIELIQHQLIAHNINPPADVQLFRCTAKACNFVTQKEDLLMKHKREIHKEFQQKCKYCSKVFNKEFLLHAHMRAVHRHVAKSDGAMEFSEDEEYEPSGGGSKNVSYSSETSSKKAKIEILSNIEIPASEAITLVGNSTTIVSQPSSEAEALTNVASGIATSIALVDNVDDQYNIEQQLAQVHGEYREEGGDDDNKKDGIITRLVAEDGTELQLTAEQKEEILQQLQQQGATLTDNVVMVLDQGQMSSVECFEGSGVSYSEAQENTTTESTTTDSVAAIKPEELEKAEIVFENDEVVEPKQKEDQAPEKSRLLADLEGDWNEENSTQESKSGEEEKEKEVDEKAEEEKNEEESKGNEELKDILNDWGDEEESTTAESNVKNSDKKEEIVEEKKNEDPVEASTEETEESKDEPAVDANEPVVKADEEKAEESETKNEETPATNEKSKIITELLDEWNEF